MAKANLGPIVERVSGELGSEVFSRGRSGPVIRNAPTYKFKPTPAMQQSADTFGQAMAFFNALSRDESKQWNAWAKTQWRHNDVTGQPYRPTGHNVFVGLTCKFLQINPGGTPPTLPPAGSFTGDAIRVDVFEDNGILLFLGSGANHAPTKTELLIQKLPTRLRQPTDKFVSVTFFSFSGVSDYYPLNVVPGIYVPAYRFVNAATGQMTERIALPEVEIA